MHGTMQTLAAAIRATMRRSPVIGSTSVSLKEATAGETELISSKYPLAGRMSITTSALFCPMRSLSTAFGDKRNGTLKVLDPNTNAPKA
jgi:hypothetical protein